VGIRPRPPHAPLFLRTAPLGSAAFIINWNLTQLCKNNRYDHCWIRSHARNFSIKSKIIKKIYRTNFIYNFLFILSYRGGCSNSADPHLTKSVFA
jgi:hypothetical protein